MAQTWVHTRASEPVSLTASPNLSSETMYRAEQTTPNTNTRTVKSMLDCPQRSSWTGKSAPCCVALMLLMSWLSIGCGSSRYSGRPSRVYQLQFHVGVAVSFARHTCRYSRCWTGQDHPIAAKRNLKRRNMTIVWKLYQGISWKSRPWMRHDGCPFHVCPGLPVPVNSVSQDRG
jgi:hypothetical protein